MTSPHSISADDRRSRFNALISFIALQLAFALTGVCLEILGPMLPALSAHLALDDAHSGLIFTALFTASAVGGLLVRGNLAHALAAGLAVTAIGAAGLLYATRLSIIPIFFIFGLGLGITMTSVSVFASRNYPRRRAATLALLNFSWSGGAAICPLFVGRQLAVHQPQSVFVIIAIASAVGAVFIFLQFRDHDHQGAQNPTTAVRSIPWRELAFFASIGLLETGIEASIGGWLSTYAHRIGFADTAHAAATASFFWTAFLVGRGIVSLLLLRVGERLILVASMLVALAGTAAILLAPTPSTFAAATMLTGLGLAAIFPVNLALFLPRITKPVHAAWMLGITGFGGSILPWLTGIISERTGSLHTGLFVPAFAIALMLGMVLVAICNRDGYLSQPNVG